MHGNGFSARSDLKRLFEHGTAGAASEGALVERFVRDDDPSALEALVGRHGPMVVAICKRWLNDPRDVEDAFQATFLVLVKRASQVERRESLGPWLAGVAKKVARRAFRDRKKRSEREASLNHDDLTRHCVIASEYSDSAELVRNEVRMLPERYRSAIRLCFLEEKTHAQAAQALNCPVGTLKGRIERGKSLLRKRLLARGLAPAVAAGLLASDERARAGGHPVTPYAYLLTRGVLRAMLFTKLKIAAACVLVPTAALFAYGYSRSHARAQDDDPRARTPAVGAGAQPSNKQGEPARSRTLGGDLADLKRRRVESASRGYDITIAMAESGRADEGAAVSWSTRWLEAELDLHQGDDERSIRALTEHANRMKKRLELDEKRAEFGRMNMADLESSRCSALEAEIRLLEFKARNNPQTPSKNAKP